jgi:hypothetical protein
MIQRSRYAVLVLAAAAAACGGGDGGTQPEPRTSPVVLQIASGDAQPGMPGEALWEPLVVRATRDGKPVQYVLISFSATDGQVSIPTIPTDAAGEARVRWVLPASEAGVAAARLRARLPAAEGADSVTFTARVPRRADMDLLIVEGGGPVKMLVYPSGGFLAGQHRRVDFADSVRLWAQPEVDSEIAAFAPGRAPLLLAPSWSRGREPLRLRFATEVVRIPLTIWVVQPPFDSTAILVQRHLQAVRDTWEAQAGIGLRDVRIVDATAYPGVSRFQHTLPELACDPSLYPAVGRDEGRLNAYYVGQPPFGSGAHCGDGNILIFPLAWQRTGYTLAHEIGHAFLGGWHETIPNNVMHFQGNGATLSAGQIFRAHYSASSILNTMFNAHPASMRRACSTSPASTTPGCPPTDFVLD